MCRSRGGGYHTLLSRRIVPARVWGSFRDTTGEFSCVFSQVTELKPLPWLLLSVKRMLTSQVLSIFSSSSSSSQSAYQQPGPRGARGAPTAQDLSCGDRVST